MSPGATHGTPDEGGGVLFGFSKGDVQRLLRKFLPCGQEVYSMFIWIGGWMSECWKSFDTNKCLVDIGTNTAMVRSAFTPQDEATV